MTSEVYLQVLRSIFSYGLHLIFHLDGYGCQQRRARDTVGIQSIFLLRVSWIPSVESAKKGYTKHVM